jgi:hypothetical protein
MVKIDQLLCCDVMDEEYVLTRMNCRYAVSPIVNKIGNDTPECVVPIQQKKGTLSSFFSAKPQTEVKEETQAPNPSITTTVSETPGTTNICTEQGRVKEEDEVLNETDATVESEEAACNSVNDVSSMDMGDDHALKAQKRKHEDIHSEESELNKTAESVENITTLESDSLDVPSMLSPLLQSETGPQTETEEQQNEHLIPALTDAPSTPQHKKVKLEPTSHPASVTPTKQRPTIDSNINKDILSPIVKRLRESNVISDDVDVSEFPLELLLELADSLPPQPSPTKAPPSSTLSTLSNKKSAPSSPKSSKPKPKTPSSSSKKKTGGSGGGGGGSSSTSSSGAKKASATGSGPSLLGYFQKT